MHSVQFFPQDLTVTASHDALLVDLAHAAGIELNVPCGGQGRCGRCAVRVERGQVRRRSTLRLSARDLEQGYVLACQALVESDCVVTIPPQDEITRHLTTEKTAAKIARPFSYDPRVDQTVSKWFLALEPPSFDDNTDDLARLQRALRAQGIENVTARLPVLRKLAHALREGSWRVTAVLERTAAGAELLDLEPGDTSASLYGAAVDVGTTTVTVYLVDLLSGEVLETAANYNAQIKRGEDVISRIVYASKNSPAGLDELNTLVRTTINQLIESCARRRHVDPASLYKLTVVGNSTMMHLLLGLPPESIRLAPYTTTLNFLPPFSAAELGLTANPGARVLCLPGIASYVGADITAGVLSSGTAEAAPLTLFLDIGTNGEMVLGNRDWLIACACSAGPAFEGAGVQFGMRATTGAIEEVWINGKTLDPTVRVIGGGPGRGLCGSGLISLLAEMFITGVTDKAGHIVATPARPRTRHGDHGPEYVVVWGDATADGRDIVITQVDIDNLLRAKAAIYAGYQMLARSVGVALSDVEQVLVGGSFGQYINVEKAIQIGLLPDLPWERFRFLGNTAARGAYMALLSSEAAEQVNEIAKKLTYLELAADNAFTDQFLAALFLPHTDLTQFPSVAPASAPHPVPDFALADE